MSYILFLFRFTLILSSCSTFDKEKKEKARKEIQVSKVLI